MSYDRREEIQKRRASILGVVCGNSCHGNGNILVPGIGFEVCSCMKQYKREARYLHAGIPPKYWDFTFDELVPEFCAQNARTLDIIKAFINTVDIQVRNNQGFFLYGERGLAKTGLCCLVLKAAIDRDLKAAFVDVPAFMGRYYNTFGNSAERDVLLNDLAWLKNETDIMVVDSVDNLYQRSDKSTTWGGHQLTEFYNTVVYNTKKSVLLTSNISQEKLYTKLPMDIEDRISELAELRLKFEGAGFRKGVTNADKITRLMVKPVAGKPFKGVASLTVNSKSKNSRV